MLVTISVPISASEKFYAEGKHFRKSPYQKQNKMM